MPATEPGTAFVPFIGPGLADIVCEHHERTVNRDNCVSFEGKRLQISAQVHRCHFIKAPRSIAPPTGVWRCSTGRASSPNTSPMAPSSQSSSLCRCVSGPEALVERVPLCGALDGTRPHQRLGGRGMGLENSRCPDAFALPPPACAGAGSAPRRACAPRGCGWLGLATPMDDRVREVPSRESASAHVRGQPATGRRGTVSPLTHPTKADNSCATKPDRSICCEHELSAHEQQFPPSPKTSIESPRPDAQAAEKAAKSR